jgi:transposase
MEVMERSKPRVRRSFTPEFKAEIVELCQRGDRSIGQVARDFDLTETAVRAWVRQAERDAGSRGDGGLTSAERQELAALRRENQRLRGDVEILKRATARSMGRCNNRREPSSRGLVLEGLSRPGVEPRGDGVEVDLRIEQNGRGSHGNRWQPCHVASLQTRIPPDRGVLDTPAEFGEVLGEACWPPARRRRLRGLLAVRIPGDRPGGCLGQAVAGGWLFWRGRRLRGAAAAAVVAPGLRPRFFSVLPTPAKFRSR